MNCFCLPNAQIRKKKKRKTNTHKQTKFSLAQNTNVRRGPQYVFSLAFSLGSAFLLKSTEIKFAFLWKISLFVYIFFIWFFSTVVFFVNSKFYMHKFTDWRLFSFLSALKRNWHKKMVAAVENSTQNIQCLYAVNLVVCSCSQILKRHFENSTVAPNYLFWWIFCEKTLFCLLFPLNLLNTSKLFFIYKKICFFCQIFHEFDEAYFCMYCAGATVHSRKSPKHVTCVTLYTFFYVLHNEQMNDVIERDGHTILLASNTRNVEKKRDKQMFLSVCCVILITFICLLSTFSLCSCMQMLVSSSSHTENHLRVCAYVSV